MKSLAESNSSHLRIFRDRDEEGTRASAHASTAVVGLCRAFSDATGWPLRYVPEAQAGKYADPLWSAPVDPGVGDAPGYLMIGEGEAGESSTKRDRAEWQTAAALAEELTGLLGRLSGARTELAKREAELAACGPVVSHPDEATHLAERLLAVLRGGAEGIGCMAAGLYLLDPATTELKLRSCWGLAPDRLLDPARPLRGAVADLEALTGHAVVLTQQVLLEYWNVPEPCAAAVCVPVSTATTLLGTLWMFSAESRDFSDRETNLVEIIAGRLAAELEREQLLSDGLASADLRRQFDVGHRLQRSQFPQVFPLADPWRLAGWTCQAAGLGGTFHDWFALADGSIAAAVGGAQSPGMAGALVTQTVRAALRAHSTYGLDPGETLARAGQGLWSGSAGDQFAAAAYLALTPASSDVHIATAGDISALVVGPDSWESLAAPEIPLGVQPDPCYTSRPATLGPESILLVASGALRDQIDSRGQRLDPRMLADALGPHCGAQPTQIMSVIRDLVGTDPAPAGQQAWSALVVTRP